MIQPSITTRSLRPRSQQQLPQRQPPSIRTHSSAIPQEHRVSSVADENTDPAKQLHRDLAQRLNLQSHPVTSRSSKESNERMRTASSVSHTSPVLARQQPLQHAQPPPPTTTTTPATTTATASKTPHKEIPKPSSSKLQCPSPPAIIQDKKLTVHFTKGKLLGEGGFARCYEVWDPAGTRFAAKVMPKQALKSQKAKQKMFMEIKVHQSMKHAHIVRFEQVFEDSENVYMILELCENKTFVEMIKKRKRVTEPEAKYYLRQILEALLYMHGRRVIHRDLKLGNLFLTKDMQVKIGDFGLATVVRQDGERKKTICGTPNYIAPEVLFDQKNGHSFEVDLWSVGVILYTLLIGKPPFQTKEVKTIYKKIRENSYEFPDNVPISPHAKDLISNLLTTKPELRPTVYECLEHVWFTHGGAPPKSLPVTALLTTPSHFQTSFAVEPMTRKSAGPSSSTSTAVVASSSSSPAPARMPLSERKPISAATTISETAAPRLLDSPGARKLTTRLPSPRPPLMKTKIASLVQPTPEKENMPRSNGFLPQQKPSPLSAEKQKTVALAVSGSPSTAYAKPPTPTVDTPAKARVPQQTVSPMTTTTPQGPSSSTPHHPQMSPAVHKMTLTPMNNPTRRSMLETMQHNLEQGLQAFKNGTLSSFPSVIPQGVVEAPKVFISKWIDYSNKYGLGYQLTNGHVGVHFNDSSSIVVSADETHFEYLEYARGSDKTVMNRHGYTLDRFPEVIQKKVTLLKHFRSYMRDNLSQAAEYNYTDKERVNNMDFLVKYVRTKHAVLFRLTNRVVQINFFDHTKLILSSDAHVVSFVNRDRQLTTFSLPSLLTQGDTEIITRLKCAKEILETLTTTGKNRNSGGGSTAVVPPSPTNAGTAGKGGDS